MCMVDEEQGPIDWEWQGLGIYAHLLVGCAACTASLLAVGLLASLLQFKGFCPGRHLNGSLFLLIFCLKTSQPQSFVSTH